MCSVGMAQCNVRSRCSRAHAMRYRKSIVLMSTYLWAGACGKVANDGIATPADASSGCTYAGHQYPTGAQLHRKTAATPAAAPPSETWSARKSPACHPMLTRPQRMLHRTIARPMSLRLARMLALSQKVPSIAGVPMIPAARQWNNFLEPDSNAREGPWLRHSRHCRGLPHQLCCGRWCGLLLG